MPQFGTYTDTRDGRVYKTVLMPDGKWWLAEDYKYLSEVNASTAWSTLYLRSRIPDSPVGCHIPTENEWRGLPVGLLLRSSTDWTTSIQSADPYGFNAKPSGVFSNGAIIFTGIYAGWWLPNGDSHRLVVSANEEESLLWYSQDALGNAHAVRLIVDSGNVPGNVPGYIPDNPFQILTPCTLQMLCDSKVANSSSGRRRTVSRDSSFVFSATLNLPSECKQFESVPYYDFPVIGDCEIRQLDLVKYTFRDTEKTSSVKCMIVPTAMNKRTGDFRISCEPNISMDEAMLVATGSSSLEVLSSSRSLSLKCVWTVSFLAATQFIEWLRGSVNRIFTTSVGGMKGVVCQIGDSVSLEIGSADVKISADLVIVNTKQFPLNVTALRVGNVVTVSTGTAYTGTLVNRSGEIVEVVATATNVLTFTTYPENCYLLIRQGNNVTEWLEL